MIRTRCGVSVLCVVGWISGAAAQTVTIDTTRTEWFDRAGKGGPGWAGGDVGASVLLPDGRSVWTWGDTFYGTVAPTGLMNAGWRFVQGNALVATSNAGGFTSVYAAGPSALFKPPTAGNSWYWMADATLDAGRLRIFMHETYRTGSGAWDFAWTGKTDVASLSLSTGRTEGVTPATGSGNGIAWGSAIMEESGYFYIYGDETVPIPGFGNWHRTHVARVLQSAGLFGPWQYFNGTTWVSDKTQTRAMTLDGGDNFSQVSGVRRLPDGRYAMLSMLFPGTTIDEYYSASPRGPWADHVVLYRPPETGVSNQYCYMARYHPQFDLNGSTSIGYSVNGAPWGTNAYRPRFILVQR